MKLLVIGSDRSIFQEGSATRLRVEKQATLFEELHIIVFSRKTHRLSPQHEGNLHLYPTGSFSRTFYVWDAIRLASALESVDVVSAQDPFEAGLAGYFVARARKAPLQLQVHTDLLSARFARGGLNRVRLLLAAYLLPRADGVRVTLQRIKEGLRRRYSLKGEVAVLPVFVDPSRFAHLTRLPRDEARKTLLWVGRFEEEKNPSAALEALAAARKEGIDARLVMLGQGTLRRALEARAQALGVVSHVVFPGWQDPLPHLARADLLLCTSYFEGYGLVIVEALAAGVPVLSTDVGVAREAGATVAPLGEFKERLVELLRGPLSQGMLRFQLMSEGEYLRAYKDTLARLCA